VPSRLEALRSFVAARPDDAFSRYALAMELRNGGNLTEAWHEFEVLLQKDEAYVPGYAPAADTLVGLGRHEEARALYLRGIELCERKGQHHARDQLQTALASLK
jgi:tetratricopeptide (TPR) repeat protein